MEFGVFDIFQVTPDIPAHRVYAARLRDAELIDRLGYEYYFVAERHFLPLYRIPAPGVWLAAVAARTQRVRLGVLAYTVPLRQPVLLAEEVSTLDHVSQGRLEVGVGLGHRPQELASLGIDPAQRQALFLEALVLMRRAWQGQPFDHRGIAFRFRELYVEPPYQRPHPPLWYAGTDPQAASWAGRNGLSLAVGFRPLAQLRATCDAWRAASQTHDMLPAAPRLALMRSLYVAETDAQARQEMVADLRRLGRLFPTSPAEATASPRPLQSAADAERALDRLLEDEVVIAGSPDTCAAAIVEAARALRLDAFLANPYLTGVEPKRIQRTLRLLASAVRPRVEAALGTSAERPR